jgi:hypothetical protein
LSLTESLGRLAMAWYDGPGPKAFLEGSPRCLP